MLQADLDNANFDANADPFIQAWNELLLDTRYALTLNWNITGAVELVSEGADSSARLSEGNGASISQVINLPDNGQSIDFDITVINAAAGDTMKVFVDGTEAASFELTSLDPGTRLSVPLSDGFDSRAEIVIVVLRTCDDSAIVELGGEEGLETVCHHPAHLAK